MKNRVYEIALNPKYDWYQGGLASMFYKTSDKRTGSGARATSKSRANVNELLAQELHKLVIKKFKRKKVYARFKR